VQDFPCTAVGSALSCRGKVLSPTPAEKETMEGAVTKKTIGIKFLSIVKIVLLTLLRSKIFRRTVGFLVASIIDSGSNNHLVSYHFLCLAINATLLERWLSTCQK